MRNIIFFRNITLFCFLSLTLNLSFGQTHYVELEKDASGVDIAAHLPGLNEKAGELCAFFDSLGYAGKFKVFSAGFFVEQEFYDPYKYPVAFENLRVIAANSSQYYLLFGRQNDVSNGVFSKYWVDLVIPSVIGQNCDLSIEKDLIYIKIKSLFDANTPIVANSIFAELEKNAMSLVLSDIKNRLLCCTGNQSACNKPCLTYEEEKILLATKHFAYLGDINLVNGQTKPADSTTQSRISATIRNDANIQINYNGVQSNLETEANAITAALGLSPSSIIITKSVNLCEYGYSLYDNLNQGQPLKIWFHILISQFPELKVELYFKSNVNLSDATSNLVSEYLLAGKVFQDLGFGEMIMNNENTSITLIDLIKGNSHPNVPDPEDPGPLITQAYKSQNAVNMDHATSGSLTITGAKRNMKDFWKIYAELNPGRLSLDNIEDAKALVAPKVNQQWVNSFPEAERPFWQSRIGEKLIHHHNDQSKWAVALPEDVHVKHSKFLHARLNKLEPKGNYTMTGWRNYLRGFAPVMSTAGFFFNLDSPDAQVNWFPDFTNGLGEIRYDVESNTYTKITSVGQMPEKNSPHFGWKDVLYFTTYIAILWDENEHVYQPIGAVADGYIVRFTKECFDRPRNNLITHFEHCFLSETECTQKVFIHNILNPMPRCKNEY